MEDGKSVYRKGGKCPYREGRKSPCHLQGVGDTAGMGAGAGGNSGFEAVDGWDLAR